MSKAYLLLNILCQMLNDSLKYTAVRMHCTLNENKLKM